MANEMNPFGRPGQQPAAAIGAAPQFQHRHAPRQPQHPPAGFQQPQPPQEGGHSQQGGHAQPFQQRPAPQQHHQHQQQPGGQPHGSFVQPGSGFHASQQAPQASQHQQPQQGYSAPFGQQQQQQQQHPQQRPFGGQQQQQQQQQQEGGQFGATLHNEFSQMGSAMGVNPLVMGVADAGLRTAGERMRSYIPGLSGVWHALRYHFDVDNLYVLNKMKLVVFPLQASWARIKDPADMIRAPRAPVADPNAPDLYLPVMSFVTFSLLVGLLQGTLGKFDPAYIQGTIMWSVTLLALEAAAARVAVSSMVLNIPSMSLLDFVCYSGYRYFGLCLIVLVEVATSGMSGPYYVALAWLGTANSLFLFQSLRASIKQARKGNPEVNEKGALLLAIVYAVLQFLFMWWLSAYNMDAAAAVPSPLAGLADTGGDAAVAEAVAGGSAAALEAALPPSAAPGPAAEGAE